MFGSASCRGEVLMPWEVSRRRPRVPPASTTAPSPPTAASEPEAALETVETDVDVDRVGDGLPIQLSELDACVEDTRKPARLRDEVSVGDRAAGGIAETSG